MDIAEKLVDEVAKAIYHASFLPKNQLEAQRRMPSPGWCWEKTSEEMREFARLQARLAIITMDRLAREQEAGK